MTVTIKSRGDTAANWTANNPTLAAREIGLETDTQLWKIGDGATAWNSLPYWPGRIVQEDAIFDGDLATGTTVIPLDDTIPQDDEGDEYLSLAFTPTNANHKLVIESVIHISHGDANWLIAALFVDTSSDALAAATGFQNIGTGILPVVIRHEMIAGTTDELTFSLRAGGATSGTISFNGSAGVARRFGGVLASWLRVREVINE